MRSRLFWAGGGLLLLGGLGLFLAALFFSLTGVYISIVPTLMAGLGGSLGFVICDAFNDIRIYKKTDRKKRRWFGVGFIAGGLAFLPLILWLYRGIEFGWALFVSVVIGILTGAAGYIIRVVIEYRKIPKEKRPSAPLFLRLPATRLGWWAVWIAIASIMLFILNLLGVNAVCSTSNPICSFFSLIYLLSVLCGLASGVVGIVAIIRKHERSLLVWLSILLCAFILYIVISINLGIGVVFF